jgi:serine/threonine-protein kinase RsbT
MIVQRHETVPLLSTEHIVGARQKVREWAVALGFSLVEQTKLVTAASELARNTLIHGGGGALRLEMIGNSLRQGLRLTFTDQGPGIADVEQALRDGYSTADGLGLGLGGSRRLVNEFEIESRLGQGTRVTVIKWK